MFALLYPTGPGPSATAGNAWVALAITGVVLIGMVVWAWAAMRPRRRDSVEEPVVTPATELGKAA